MGETAKLSCGGSKGGKENLGKDGWAERKSNDFKKDFKIESAKAIKGLGVSECG